MFPTALDILCAVAHNALPTLGQLDLAGRALVPGATLVYADDQRGRAGSSLGGRTVVLKRGNLRLVVGADYLDMRDENGQPAYSQSIRIAGHTGQVSIRVTLWDENIERANSAEKAKKRPNKKNIRSAEIYSAGGHGLTATEALLDLERNAERWWRNPVGPVHAALAAAA